MSKTRHINHMVMLAHTVMGNVGILGLDGDKFVTQFGRRHWEKVKAAVSVMSDAKEVEIVLAAVTSEKPDNTTTPHRVTGWSQVNPIITCELQSKCGHEIVSDIATAVVLATIWDILNPPKKKEVD